ncbi:MAG TPA: PQQ-binding-like beta-propeller repeat protein [Nocardioides sp.]|nr:PQQ-binding-like beta-propeller repeat protein [Nocardioides sp.]
MLGPTRQVARGFTAGVLLGALVGCGGADRDGTPGSRPDDSDTWVARHDSGAPAPDAAGGVVLSPAGDRVFVTGASATIAYDAVTGDELWQVPGEFPASGGSPPPPVIAVSPDGAAVFVAGRARVLAYAAEDGRPLWTAPFGPTVGRGAEAHVVAVAPDGSAVYVHGSGKVDGGDTDLVTASYDPVDGSLRWAAASGAVRGRPDYLWLSGSRSLAVAPAGDAVYVAGTAQARGSRTDYLTVALRARDGRRIWARRYDGPAGRDDIGGAVAVTADGARVVSVGSSVGRGGQADVTTVAYDARSGHQAWVSTYDGPDHANDVATLVAAAPDDDVVFVAGSSERPTTGRRDYLVLAYAVGTGERRWVRFHDGGGEGQRDDEAGALAVSPGGDALYVTGWSVDAVAGSAVATVAYAPSGRLLWDASYDDAVRGGERALEIAASDERVVVNATSDGDMATVAYPD